MESLKNPGSDVTVYSDSKYVVDSVVKKWVFGWEKIGFKKKKNPDLWARFLQIYRKHKVEFIWIKGHAGNEENEVCDRLAVSASKISKHLIDVFYENSDRNENDS